MWGVYVLWSARGAVLAVIAIVAVVGGGASAVAGEFAPGSRTSAASSPAMVVAAYIAALDRHDPVAVCGVFAPGRILSHLATGCTVRYLPQDVEAHFRHYYSRHRWASARSRGPAHTTIDRAPGAQRFGWCWYIAMSVRVPPRPSHAIRDSTFGPRSSICCAPRVDGGSSRPWSTGEGASRPRRPARIVVLQQLRATTWTRHHAPRAVVSEPATGQEHGEPNPAARPATYRV